MPELAVRLTVGDEVLEAFADVPVCIAGDSAPLEIAEGISAQQPLLLAETTPLTIMFYIAGNVTLGVAAGLIANALWERLSRRKPPEKIRLNRREYHFDSEGQLRDVILEELETGSRDE